MDDVEDGRGDQEDEFLSEQQEVKLLFKSFSAYLMSGLYSFFHSYQIKNNQFLNL